MAIAKLTDGTAVWQAVREYDTSGRAAFLQTHGFAPATRYMVQHAGRLYDAKAIVGVAYGYQFPDEGPLAAGDFSGGEASANQVLRNLGFTVIDARPSTVAGEKYWRLAVYEHLTTTHNPDALAPAILREWGVYGGAQGIWVDSRRTRSLDARGVTVGVLHTGAHYADDLTDDGVLYHYPRTGRPSGRDRAEVDATKAAADSGVPIFVISYPRPGAATRHLRLGWVEGWDDESELFLIALDEEPPVEILVSDQSDDEEFQLLVQRRGRVDRSVQVRAAQNRFKLQVIHRYGARCPLTGVTVTQMLEAAHIVPYAKGGTDDPRNGLLLNAALHRALDADLFMIEPSNLAVVTRPNGPSVRDLGITTAGISQLPRWPHPEALRWRYQHWCKRVGISAET